MLTVLALTATAHAETPMSAQAFESYVTGYTFEFTSQGLHYGAEEYLENRKVQWADAEGDCREGEWYVAGDQICFIYEDLLDPQCWAVYLRGGRMFVRFEDNPLGTELYESKRTSAPLQCRGPRIGV